MAAVLGEMAASILAAVSTVVALFAGNAILEIVSRYQAADYLLDRVDGLEMETAATGAVLDSRTKMAVVRDLQSKGQNIYPSLYTHNILESMTDEEKLSGSALVPLGFS